MPNILYEDRDLVVACKPAGCLSEDDGGETCMPGQLRAHYRGLGQPDYIATVHRLDKLVSGLMVFSRRKEITGKLTAAIAAHQVCKEYLAVLRGHPQQPEAVLEDLLFRDSTKNKTYVVQRMRKGVRPASLSYRVLEQTDALTLVRIRLHTGRTHQIRAQFSSRQLPLLGDIRYGSKDPGCDVALWATRLQLQHPKTGAPMSFTQLPPSQYPWNLFSRDQYNLIDLE